MNKEIMMSDEGSIVDKLLERAKAGDGGAIGILMARHRDRLKRMVELRMDPRLRARLDPSDVVQEGAIEVARRLPEFLRDRSLPFFVWLRLVVGERLVVLHRRHLGA